MKMQAVRIATLAVLLLAATTACTRHNDADSAVPGTNAARSGTAAAPATSSTAGQSR